MNKTLYLFPDTNLFVQCRSLEELDWKVLGSVDSIVLVLTPPVLSEIDKQKGGQGRLAKRARKANALVRRLLTEESIPIKTGKKSPTVTIVPGDALKPLSDLNEELDYSTVDDKLIGTVAGYLRTHPDRQSGVLSHDTGPLMSAKRVGIPFFPIPDDWLLGPESDDEQKRTTHLEAELARYKQAEPVCTIACVDVPREFRLTKHTPLTEEQIGQLMAKLKERYPMVTKYGAREPKHRETRGIALAAFGRDVFKPSTDEEIAKYREELYPAWLVACQEVFSNLHTQLDGLDPMPVIEFRLCNEGARPAEDVLIRFEAIGGRFGVFVPSDEDNDESNDPSDDLQLPRPPNAPQGVWVKELPRFMANSLAMLKRAQVVSDMIRPLSPLFQPIVRDSNNFYWKGGRSKYPKVAVELTCQQWRHHDGDEVYDLQLMSKREVGVIKGAIMVTIHAANLTNPVVHTQPISIVIEEGDILADAEALLAIPPSSGFSISGISKQESS